MASELVIISPELSAGSGGLADHTRNLLQQWPRIPSLTLLVPKSIGLTDGLIGDSRTLGTSSETILEQLPTGPGKVFVQYSAYGFSRTGYPRELIRALITWKKRTGGRLVVMFHEIWAFCAFTNKNFVVQQLHRHALKNLLRCCDAAFTTTESQSEHLGKLLTESKVQVLPAGSNIRPTQSIRGNRQRGCAVLFGLQSNRVRSLRHLRKSLVALAAGRRITKLISVGGGSDPELDNDERELLTGIELTHGFEQLGPLSEPKVSEVLSRAEIGIFGQSELSCTKSGSFMAYAAHQLNVVADFAAPSKPPPVCWSVAPDELLGGISDDELTQRARCLRMWQEENGSWGVIAGKIGRALYLEGSPAELIKHPVST